MTNNIERETGEENNRADDSTQEKKTDFRTAAVQREDSAELSSR